MVFHETWQMVLGGTKTQTRRLVKEGERLAPGGCHFFDAVMRPGKDFADILKWENRQATVSLDRQTERA